MTEEISYAPQTTIEGVACGDRIVVQRLPEATSSEGGIIIPDNSKEKPVEGVVVSQGDGKLIETQGHRIACAFNIGDRVLFGKYAGADIIIGGKDYTILREDEVLFRSFLPLASPAPEAPPHAEDDPPPQEPQHE